MNTYQYILKKYNINPGRQYIIEIPNMGRADLAALFAELKFKKGVEVDDHRGSFHLPYAEHLLKDVVAPHGRAAPPAQEEAA